MKNYRTWWRKTGEAVFLLLRPRFSDNVLDGQEFDYYCEDSNTMDCMAEQEWAIREGLA